MTEVLVNRIRIGGLDLPVPSNTPVEVSFSGILLYLGHEKRTNLREWAEERAAKCRETYSVVKMDAVEIGGRPAFRIQASWSPGTSKEEQVELVLGDVKFPAGPFSEYVTLGPGGESLKAYFSEDEACAFTPDALSWTEGEVQIGSLFIGDETVQPVIINVSGLELGWFEADCTLEHALVHQEDVAETMLESMERRERADLPASPTEIWGPDKIDSIYKIDSIWRYAVLRLGGRLAFAQMSLKPSAPPESMVFWEAVMASG